MKKLRRTFLLLPILCACGGGAQDGRFPFGSRAMIASTDYRALYVANQDDPTLSILRIDGDTPVLDRSIALGKEPMRVARAGERVFVTLRGERAVAVLSGSPLQLEQKLPVGAEPYGIVADESGTRIWVASSLSGRVDEIDARTLAVLRSFAVEDEPRWLALHPGGHGLYVASALRGTLSRIDLGSGEVKKLTLPAMKGGAKDDRFSFEARITGDPAVTPDGAYLLIPALYVNNTTPVAEDETTQAADSGGGYASGPGARFNPVVVIASAGGGGEPDLSGAELVSARAPEVAGYPSSITITPDSKTMLIAIEGSAAVLAAPIEQKNFGAALLHVAEKAGDPEGLHLASRATAVIKTPAGPRAAVFIDGGKAFTFSFIDRQVTALDVARFKDTLLKAPPVSVFAESVIGSAVAVSTSPLAPEIERGRKLFYAVNDPRVSSPGLGLSCGTCHFEGRADGLTWSFTRGGRQTPSLAGKASLTQPVRWEGDRASVAEDAQSTSAKLMGGHDLSADDAADLAAFVDTIRRPDLPLFGSTEDGVQRGQAIFERPEVGCAACHNGARLTDNLLHPMMFGLAQVKTRSLTGVASTPPYLHDGSAATLRDVLIRSKSGEMGNTSGLSESELADLESYLRSL